MKPFRPKLGYPIYLPQDVHRLVKRLARQEERTMYGMVRVMAETYQQTQGGHADDGQTRRGLPGE